MAIAKLNLVSLDFDKDNCNDVLLELYQRDDFHPEQASFRIVLLVFQLTTMTIFMKNCYQELKK